VANIRLSPQQMQASGVTPTYITSGASPLLNVTDTFLVNNDGKVFLHFKKTGAGGCNVTIQTPGNVDGLAIADRVVVVPATVGDVMIGPFPPSVYNQPGTHDMYVTVSEVTGLSCAIIRAQN
jgi:hypothetical protein